MGLPKQVLAMADAHSGALSRRDVRAMGFSAAAFEWWVRQRLIIHVCRGEYRVAGSSFPVPQEMASIVARAGRGAHIGGALGLSLLGVRGFFATDLDHIAVPAPRRVTASPSKRSARSSQRATGRGGTACRC